MDKELWTQVEELFDQVVRLSNAERGSFIDQATENNSQLKQEVVSLLSHHDLQESPSDLESDPKLRSAISSIVNKIDTRLSIGIPDATRSENGRRDDELASILQTLDPDFLVRNVISHGGMGTVFRVYQKTLHRDIAVKVLHSIDMDERSRKQFVRESQLAAGVHSDFVVEIISVHDYPQFPYLSMEFIDGPSLRELIETKGPLSPMKAAEFANQIATGLQACHEARLIHRDVKPANIMLQKRPAPESSVDAEHLIRAKLIDFGIAQDLTESEQAADQMSAGTPAYMSPEQVLAPENVDQRSDIYGLGATLYQMLVGEPPFRGSSHMILKQIGNSDPTPLRKLDDRIPKDLESICLKALNSEPKQRYDSAGAMAEDLQNYVEGRPTVARPISTIEKLQKWCVRNRRLAASLLAAISFLLVLTLSSIAFSLVLIAKDREIARQQLVNIEARVRVIVDSDPGALQSSIRNVLPLKTPTTDALRAQLDASDNGLNRRVNAAVALSYSDPTAVEFVVRNLDGMFTSPAVCANALAALNNHPEADRLLLGSLDRATDESAKAKRIILLAHLGHWSQWQSTARATPTPELRTNVIHGLAIWHGDISDLLKTLGNEPDQPWLWSLCQAIALIDKRSLNQGSVDDVSDFLTELHARTRHYTVRASAEAALKKWKISHENVDSLDTPKNWMTLKNGIRLVRIEPGKTLVGRIDPSSRFQGFPPHVVVISRPYYFADAETTVGQYREYIAAIADENNHQEASKVEWNLDPNISSTNEHPAQMVNWFDAVKFCNWLSRSQGLGPAYRQNDEPLKVKTESGDVEIEDWVLVPGSNGFRLPTEAQWEFACRSFSQTPYYYGSDPELFKYYGLGSQFTTLAAGPVRSRLPNSLGLFDMHGNVWEWCHDWYSEVMDTQLVDPYGPAQPIAENGPPGRVYRGGGVGTLSGRINSESRGQTAPAAMYDNLGFRVVLPAQDD